MSDTHIWVFGTVHSDRTVVVLLHKHFSSWHSSSFNSVSITQNLHMLLWASLSLWHMSTICSPLSSRLITSNLSSLQIVLHGFSTWIALGDVDLCFSIMLSRKVNDLKEETTWAMWLYHQRNKSIHVTDGVTVMSLSASLVQKIRAPMDRLCQIALNWKLTHEFKKQFKFSSCMTPKSWKKNPMKWDLPALSDFLFLFQLMWIILHFSSVNLQKNGVRIN